MTTYDWNALRKAADDASKPIPDDWYDVVVDKAEATVASTGSKMLKVKLRVVGGPYDGRVLFTNFVMSTENGFAMSIFFRNLDALGINPQRDAPGGSMEELAFAMTGRQARAQVGTRVWQNQPRNEINNMARSGSPQVGVPGGGPSVPTPGAVAPAPTPVSMPTTPTPASAPVSVTPTSGGSGAPPLPF